ncbi:MAG: putative acetyltransferase [Acidimicrobiaceae bacterium]|jgi:GNAT superfamily N-acetyltransferase|nr:putative acetyltransferase [Acidimicrobiaceae bacterium]
MSSSLAEAAAALADELDASLPSWIRGTIEQRVEAAFGAVTPEASKGARDAAERVRAEIVPRIHDLLGSDMDAHRTTPQALVRQAVPYATAVLRGLGVPELRRDAFVSERFPDDVYDLTPASLAALGEETGELAIIWGAAKAHEHRLRHSGQADARSPVTPEPSLRRADIGEVQAIADVWLRSRAASVPAIPLPVHGDSDIRAWFSDVVLATREVWVAEASGGEIVGVLVLEHGWLDQLYLDPGWTNRGIGSRLVDIAKARRPEGLDLWTFQANHGARRFYERHGFTAVEITEGDNEEGAPDVRYRWRRS